MLHTNVFVADDLVSQTIMDRDATEQCQHAAEQL